MEPSENPIINRLKEFMQQTGMSNSQFADYTGIPRPTLSQLLHGRNKSVNDQLMRKLHETFPALNVVWLLFGKGDMLNDSNIEISEPEKYDFSTKNAEQSSVNQPQDTFVNPFVNIEQSTEKPYKMADSGLFGLSDSDNPADVMNYTPSEEGLQSEQRERTEPPMNAAINFSAEQKKKKIASIIVLYTDNSFETFVPDR